MELGNLKKGRLGGCRRMVNGARPAGVYHPAFKKEREKKEDVEELFLLTQRFSKCIFQEDCLDMAILLHWGGFSCLYCPFRNKPEYEAKIGDMRGRISFEI